VPEDARPTYTQPDFSLLGDEHVARYRETDGEVGYLWNGATTLLLTTTGRTSGEARTVALIYAADGDRPIVIASMGGAPQHPQWYRNLEANPDVEVQIRGERFHARAHVLDGDERTRGWQLAAAQWPNYDVYQERTTRVIPVVALERA
jgi:deazaflavin-dependent oxidoreductase (nitroreductase family)